MATFALFSKSADSFGLAPESADDEYDIHELTFSTQHGNTYRVVYVIRGKTVHVLRVRGIGQPLLSQDEIIFPD